MEENEQLLANAIASAGESVSGDDSLLVAHVLEKDGCPLHYWVGGPAGRPLVVFTHGACMDHHAFDPQVAAVARSFRVVTWDVRGHGQSRPMGRDYSLSLAVNDLLAIVDRVGDPRATHVGHSNGSYIAQELVFRHPERVEALVVADGTCITAERTAFELLLARLVPHAMGLIPFGALKRSGLTLHALNQNVRDEILRAFSQIPRRDFLTILRAVSDSLHSEPGYRIPVPLLLVHGDDDRLGDIRSRAPAWAAREPDCRYVVVPRARHLAQLDNPDFFTSILLDYLATGIDDRGPASSD